MRSSVRSIAIGVSLLTAADSMVFAFAQGVTKDVGSPQARTSALTEEDRSEIKLLSGRYLLALSSCDAEAYADLFAVPDGFFASIGRGKVDGRHRLTEMVKSYSCDYVNGVAPPHAPTPPAPYKIVVEPAPDGAIGLAYLNGARYEDEYVKTPRGWRFKSRTVVTNADLAANLSSTDFDAIQQLAMRAGGPYADVYETRPDGSSRFKSAGVDIAASAGGAVGKAYLKDGGYYNDTYVRTPQGWRLQSRVLVPGGEKK